MATLTQLQYIVTVDKLKHFAKAAKECHVSQPSLSMQIQKVEDELGIVIFDRLKKPIVSTENGKKFIEQAKVVLREHQRLLDSTKQNQQELSGDFKLAIIPTIAPYLLPLFIEDFAKSYPKVKLQVDELKTESIIKALHEDTIDAALLATPLQEQGLKEQVLYYEPFSVYTSKLHPFYGQKKINETDLDGSDMWLLQDGHCLRNQIVKLCSLKNEKSVFKNIRFEGGNLNTLRYLIKSSKGYTLVPELFVKTLSDQEQNQFIRRFEQPVPSREVSLVYRRDQWKLDLMNALEDKIIQNLPEGLITDLSKAKKNKIHRLGV